MNVKEHFDRAEKYFEEKNFDGVISDLNEVLKLEPDNAAAFYNRGMAYMGKNEPDLAIADIDKAIKLDPNESSFFAGRASAYYLKGKKILALKGKIDLAVSDMEMAVKLNPQNDDYRQSLKELKDESILRRKKRTKEILVGGAIGIVLGAVYVIISATGSSSSPAYIIGAIAAGMWVGIGVCGNIGFLLLAFIKGQTLFGFLDFGWWDSKSTFGVNIAFIIFRLFLGLFVAWLGLFVFVLTGPVIPLIRFFMLKSQLKKLQI